MMFCIATGAAKMAATLFSQCFNFVVLALQIWFSLVFGNRLRGILLLLFLKCDTGSLNFSRLFSHL